MLWIFYNKILECTLQKHGTNDVVDITHWLSSVIDTMYYNTFDQLETLYC